MGARGQQGWSRRSNSAEGNAKPTQKNQEVLLSPTGASRAAPSSDPTTSASSSSRRPHNWGPLHGTVRKALLKGHRLGLPEASNQGHREESGSTLPCPRQGPFSQS